jgi:UDP-N-acetylglucosamine--N-acetylmuramyl-(pentapeptide) pyrophosphoryl-undecaprenol N-acetylglucosamine transferase
MADAGAAVVVSDGELSAARLRAEVDGLLGDPDRLAAMGRASAALARPDAAGAVAAQLRAAAAAPGRSRRRRGGADEGRRA